MYSFKVIEYSTRSEKFFLSPRATRTHHYHFGLAAFAWELLVRQFVWAEQNVFFFCLVSKNNYVIRNWGMNLYTDMGMGSNFWK